MACTADTAGLATSVINPVHDFVMNDTRFAAFALQCNEWRVTAFKIRV